MSTWRFMSTTCQGHLLTLVQITQIQLFLNLFSSITADLNISSALRWAIQNHWSSGCTLIGSVRKWAIDGLMVWWMNGRLGGWVGEWMDGWINVQIVPAWNFGIVTFSRSCRFMTYFVASSYNVFPLKIMSSLTILSRSLKMLARLRKIISHVREILCRSFTLTNSSHKMIMSRERNI